MIIDWVSLYPLLLLRGCLFPLSLSHSLLLKPFIFSHKHTHANAVNACSRIRISEFTLLDMFIANKKGIPWNENTISRSAAEDNCFKQSVSSLSPGGVHQCSPAASTCYDQKRRVGQSEGTVCSPEPCQVIPLCHSEHVADIKAIHMLEISFLY